MPTKMGRKFGCPILLESGAVVDRIHDEVEGMDFELIASNLPKEQEEKLRETFAA